MGSDERMPAARTVRLGFSVARFGESLGEPNDANGTMLLHGFTGSADSWLPLAAHLPHAAFALDLPGHRAGSPLTNPPDTFEQLASRLGTLLETLRPGTRWNLVGYSLGARLALGTAVAHPGLVGAMTLIGVHPGLSDSTERAARRAADDRWVRLLCDEGLAAFLRAWEAQPVFAGQDELPVEAVEFQRSIRRDHDPAQLALAMRALGLSRMPDYTACLAGLNFPVHLVVGGRDAKFRALAEGMVERLPRGTYTVVEGCGHNVLLERPAALATLIGRP